MVKRHKALQSLSKEHFTGLTLAQRLMKGYPHHLKSKWPSNDDIHAQTRRAIQVYDVDLIYHFEAEEKLLFLKIKDYFKTSEEKTVLNATINQHKMINKVFKILNAGDLETIRKKMIDLGKLLEEHIRFEERELFPLIEKLVPSETLIDIGVHLNEREVYDCSLLL